MPELPEVETIARGLKPLIVGRKITALEVLEDKTFQFDTDVITEVMIEQEISSIRRRAKVMLWDLSSNFTLMFHLKMTGQIIYEASKDSVSSRKNKVESTKQLTPNSQLPTPTNQRFVGGHPTASMEPGSQLPDNSTRAIFILDNGAKVFFNDQRKFGWIKLVLTKDVAKDRFLSSIGPEFDDKDFTPDYFWHKTKKRISPIKAVLLDQSVVAGIGNIYADEALHLAKVHPSRKASSLSRAESSRIFEAIKQVLASGIAHGGTSFTSYVNALGKTGDYLAQARVFRREGLLCKECGAEIIKTRVAGRGTHYCPVCQVPPSGWKRP